MTDRRWLLPALALLASCGGSDDRSSGTIIGAADDSDGARLEQAAVRAGLVESAALPPIGLYEQKHDGGADRLCVVRGKGKEYRFGLEAHFGEDMRCRGHGTARQSGDRFILNFARSACLVLADYQGDRIVMPGSVDRDCASLCTGRASLDGVSFPRASREEGSATAARDSGGASLCNS